MTTEGAREHDRVGRPERASGHPRGHRRPAARLPARADRLRRARVTDGLLRGARRRGRRQLRQAAQGPVPPRLVRHPGRRLRRRLPRLPDLPRARPDPGLAGRHRRHRQPRPRARQLRRLRHPRLPRRRAARPDPTCVGETVAGLDGQPADELEELVAHAGPRHRRHRHPGRRRPGGLRPAGRRRRHAAILNFAPCVLVGARRRRRAQGRPVDRAADPRLPRAAQGAARAGDRAPRSRRAARGEAVGR